MSIPRAQRTNFRVGKYDVEARPMDGAAHMLVYIVRCKGKTLGALASMPEESDCKFMESPPAVPPLKPFVYYRPGRPKKGTQSPAGETPAPALRENLPADAIPDALQDRMSLR